jgi:putative nucleotidyltransferase with HDIG domain
MPESVSDLRDELRERFATDTINLPLLSESVQRVLSACSDESADAKSLSELIRRDQALAGHLLRMANSTMFSRGAPIVSLQQAVSRLGMSKVREIALAISMRTRVFDVKGFAQELALLFRHALATALFAEEVARMRRRNVEEGFLGGLLHDVGKPLVLQAILDAKGPAAREVQGSPEAVWALVRELHPVAGRALAASWKLPASLGDMIAGHHDLTSETPGVHVIRFADDLAHFALADEPMDRVALEQHPFTTALNLYPEDVETLLSHRDRVAEATL